MTTEERNKAVVLEAFDTLFNRRDYAAAQRFWSPDYIQHSAHIEPGREGLFELVKASPPDMRYENGLIVANGDYVMLHGRFTDIGQPANWIAADIVRLENGLLAEHWDVRRDLPNTGMTRYWPPGRRNAIVPQRFPRNSSVAGEPDAA
jgi:predicted SnoaL-like aldol condensation-catalyzing enzyme